jgi:4-alpha-glucanotransferase
MKPRRSGIVLHITSLPSPYGIGDLGPGAYRFVDFLNAAGQSVWQILPLNPGSAICGYSPYCSYSAYAGNPLLISPDLLLEEGLLFPEDMEYCPVFPNSKVQYEAASQCKSGLLRLAYKRFINRIEKDCDYEKFCEGSSFWLDDYALFITLKEQFSSGAWNEWPRELRDRADWALGEWRHKLRERINEEKFFQYLFFKQWMALKGYCKKKGIQIIGDMPIYVSYDSSDVWSDPYVFDLDDQKRPNFVSGVPPDYFSETGQLWGNPVYLWNRLEETGYAWWIKRLEHSLKLYDMIRLDHFRGFVGFWQIPRGETTAVKGEWVEAPAWDFFRTLLKHFPYLPIIAEDLGIITPDVREVVNAFGFPGMKILLFSFGNDLPSNPYIPHNHVRNSVVYTGTHDNNTAKGWFRSEASPEDRNRLFRYIGREVNEDDVHWALIRLAMMSVSDTAICQMQDVLGLGEEARMNLPATTYNNWEWRLLPDDLTQPLTDKLLEMTRLYGRA